jgi:hypothetical protein
LAKIEIVTGDAVVLVSVTNEMMEYVDPPGEYRTVAPVPT